MSLRKRGLAAGIILASGALALSACSSGGSGGSSTGGTGSSGGTFSIAIEAPQSGLAPTNCYDLYCAQVDQGLYTGLFEFITDDSGAMVPQNSFLTKSVTPSDDNKTYTIEINEGNAFTNGEKVTAQTFVDTFNFAANGGNGQQLGFIFGPSQLNVVGYDKVSGTDSTDGKMAGLKAVNDTTLEIQLAAPLNQSLFMNFMAGPQIYPMPSEAFKDLKAYQKQPIGNGPYKLEAAWDNATGGKLVKNPDFNGTAGSADSIDVRIYSSNDALWADLQGNNLDVATTLPQNSLASASSVLGDRYINDPGGLQYSYYGFAADDPTYKSKDVRIAIAKAINTEEINQKLYYGTRQAGQSFAPSTIAGGGTDICGDNCVFDAAAAKSLLDKAGGLPSGSKVHVTKLANETGDVQTAICNQIQANLGVECVVDTYKDFGTFLDAQENKEVPDGTLIGSGWIADNPTIQNMITANFTSDSPNNYVGYKSEQFDKLLLEGTQAKDDSEQIAKWQEAEKTLLTDFPAWPFQLRNTVGGYSTKVGNVSINPGGFVNLSTITVNQ